MLDGHKVLFSGMQATGNLTLGNYLGALKNWVQNGIHCCTDSRRGHYPGLFRIPALFRVHSRSLLPAGGMAE